MKHIVLCLIAITPIILTAHPGGLDKEGGHVDKKTGTYHTHKKKIAEKTKPVETPAKTPTKTDAKP